MNDKEKRKVLGKVIETAIKVEMNSHYYSFEGKTYKKKEVQ